MTASFLKEPSLMAERKVFGKTSIHRAREQHVADTRRAKRLGGGNIGKRPGIPKELRKWAEASTAA
jgi:hypothetical protein